MIFSFIPFNTIFGLRDIDVTVKPRRINTKATYIIKLKLDIPLEVHDWIKIIWPKGTKLPVLPENPVEKEKELKRIVESIFIGTSPCTACQGLPEINYKENSIRFNIHMELNPNIEGYETTTITVTDRVGIINPEKQGSYILKVATAKEGVATQSNPYLIVESKIGEPSGIPEVTVEPTSYGVNAIYNIKFNVGIGGELSSNQSRIKVKFPKETQLPFISDKLNPTFIKVNNKPLGTRFTISENIITIISPVNVENSGEVIVCFDRSVGIINPLKPGDYTLFVSTSEDPEWVQSKPYTIEKDSIQLIIDPPKVKKIAEYSFSFIIESQSVIDPTAPFYVLFPENIKLNDSIDNNAVLINNESPKEVRVRENIVSIYSSTYYESSSLISITFTKEAKIKNPDKESFVKLAYKLRDTAEWRYTKEVLIKEVKLEIKSINLEPNNANANAKFTLEFTLGGEGELKENDSIFIKFENTFSIPKSIEITLVTLNREYPKSLIVKDNNLLQIIVKKTFLPEENITLVIEKEAGIINPKKGDDYYTISMFTSSEREEVSSPQFYIAPPLPETKIVLKEGKIGKSGFYIYPPILSFEVSDPSSKTYFWWNDQNENKLLYTAPAPLDFGQYKAKLYYFSTSAYGDEEPKAADILVDTVLPELIIDEPTEKYHITNLNPFLVKGIISKQGITIYGVDTYLIDNILYINQTKVPVSDTDGSFSYDLSLTEGENKVLIRAEDIAGNYVEREYTILLDSIPPNVNITSPKEGEVILTPKLTVKGITENDAQLLINGEIVFVEEDGSFEHELSLKEVGKNTITIEAIDPTGNTTKSELNIYFGYTIILKIGDSSALINDTEKTLDVPPFIQSGRTLVPFRFIGEALGAKIGFTQDPKTKLTKTVSYELGSIRIILTINNKTADVNGRKVQLDVAPIIVKGRTFVPVRFVSENLGASVEWIAEEEKIIVKYPKI